MPSLKARKRLQPVTGLLPLIPGAEAALLRALPSESLGLLLATNRHLRDIVRGFVSIITIRQSKDMAPLQNWVFLTQLNLSAACIREQDIALLIRGSLSRLQGLDLSHNKLSPAAAQQLSCSCWPLLNTLKLDETLADYRARMPVKLGPRNEAIIAACRELAKAHWPQLTALDISQNTLSPPAWQWLAKAHWPNMKKLTARQSMSFGSRASLQHVATAYWPSLAQLDLTWNHFPQNAFHGVCLADWPHLTSLEVGDPLGYHMDSKYGVPIHRSLSQVAPLWERLRRLIINVSISLDNVAALVASPGQALDTLIVESANGIRGLGSAGPSAAVWPRNTQLSLSAYFEASQLHLLKAGYWPISDLTLWDKPHSDCAAAVKELLQLDLLALQRFSIQISEGCNHQHLDMICQGIVTADWPSLRQLMLNGLMHGDMRSHHLSASGPAADCLFLLSKGKWPMLHKIGFFGDVGKDFMSLQAFQLLAHGNWPLFRKLILPKKYPDVDVYLQALFAKWPYLQIDNFVKY